MKLSICCITYNQEKYIKDTIESFLNQNIDFDYEIIIGDDASTDGTQNILKEYKNKYPNIIKLILLNKNMGVMNNFINVLKEAKGEYVAYSDGDDYWIDEFKIEKQINALEKNPQCAFSFHDTLLVDENKQPIRLLSKGRLNENYKDGIISGREVISAPIRIVHANSLLFRQEAIEDLMLLEKLKFSPNGDFALTTILADKGNAYYFKKPMGVYRIVKSSVSNSRSISNKRLLDELFCFYNIIDKHFNYKFHNEINCNKIGMKMQHFEELLHNARKNTNYLLFLRAAVNMLLNHKNSQYSLKDVLWIIKEKLKEENIDEKE